MILAKVCRNIGWSKLGGQIRNTATVIQSVQYSSFEQRKPEGDTNVKIIRATRGHREGLIRLMRESFVKYEPVEMTLGVTWDEACETYTAKVDGALDQPVSLVAVHPEHGAIGCAISAFFLINPDREPDPNDMFFVKGDAPNLRIFQTMIDQVMRGWEGKFAEKGFSSALLLGLLSLDPRFGGQGLGEGLVRENMLLAQRLRADCVFATATNRHAQRAFIKAGCEVWKSVDYDSMINEKTGKPWCVPKEGTKAMQWVTKVLK